LTTIAIRSVTLRTVLSLSISLFVVSAAAAKYLFERAISPWEIAAPYTVFVLLLIPFLGCGFPDVAAGLRLVGASGPAGAIALQALLVVPGSVALLVMNGTASLVPACGVLLYGTGVTFFLLWARRLGPPPNVVDLLAVMAAWFPMELGLLQGLWAHGNVDPSYLIGKTLSVSVLVVGFRAVRPMTGLGYRWRLRLEDVGTAAMLLAIFLVPAIPFGIVTHFVAWVPKPSSFSGIVFRALGIGLFIALPEEILFRGVIFNLLQKWTTGRFGPYPALVLSSVIFGLAHLNNFPYGDWRYTLLATYAGFCYGWCYLRTGNLMAGILTHTGVDMIHRLFLVTPR